MSRPSKTRICNSPEVLFNVLVVHLCDESLDEGLVHISVPLPYPAGQRLRAALVDPEMPDQEPDCEDPQTGGGEQQQFLQHLLR